MPPSTAGGVGVDDRAELRHQAEQDRDDRGDEVGRGGVDPGGGHDADVLGVRRGRRAADGGGDHGADAVGGDGAAHHRVEVGPGHLGDRLDVADVLGDQRDHRRQHQQREGDRERRQVPADGVEVAGRGLVADAARRRSCRGSRTSRRASTAVQSTRSCGPGSALAGRGRGDLAEDLVGEPRDEVAEDQAEEDRDPAEEAAQADRHQDHRGHRDDARSTGRPACRRLVATGARLKPISMTTAPVTTGGSTRVDGVRRRGRG